VSLTRLLDRALPPTVPARRQLPHPSPFLWCANYFLSSNLSSDLDPTPIHTDFTGRCSRSPILRSHLPRQQPGCDADRAMGCLALQGRWLLCLMRWPWIAYSTMSFLLLYHRTRRIGTVGGFTISMYAHFQFDLDIEIKLRHQLQSILSQYIRSPSLLLLRRILRLKGLHLGSVLWSWIV
jgi:hypothetical protein